MERRMYTYLFDASAAVHLYVPHGPRVDKKKKILDYIVQQRSPFRQAALLIPSFCIAEVFNTFARMYFRPTEHDKPLTAKEYEACLGELRRDIIWERTLYSYDLVRNHILAVDAIIPVEHKLPPTEGRSALSTLDILVIAMACELAYLGDPEGVYLVTCDRRMKTVFEQLKNTPESELKRLKVERVIIGQPEGQRWKPPNVLLLQDAGPNDIPRVEGQPPLNIR